jgi:alkylhydroperoxidase family enzyme
MGAESLRAEDVRAIAPEAFTALDILMTTAPTALDPALVELARSQVATTLGTESGSLDHVMPSSLSRDGERACRVLAAQFVIDVGSTTDAQRAAATEALGTDAFGFVQTLYVFDWTTRLRAALREIFDVDPLANPDVDAAESLWAASEAMFAAVARLQALDPVTTEMVRLRGARAHNCRLCKSLRNVRAANAGVDEHVYDKIDRYETSDLSERHKVALRLTDAMLWQPLRHPAGLHEQAQSELTNEEVVEVLLDVTRNAANKIAVVLGADDAHVTEGVEYFDTTDAGDLVYGLSPSR